VIFKERHLSIPFVGDDVTKDFSIAAKQIVKSLAPKEKDVIVVWVRNYGEGGKWRACCYLDAS
jgi:U3 small nucleolar RNA-associated protein 14